MNKLLYLLPAFCTGIFFLSCSDVQTQNTGIGKMPVNSGKNLILPLSENKTQPGLLNENESGFPALNDDLILCANGALPYYVSCEDSARSEKIIYSNGKIMAEGKFKNGKRKGTWTSYYNNAAASEEKNHGNISAKGNFENGFPTGKWIFYYSNGNKKSEGEFAKGKFELGCAGSNNFVSASIKNGKWDFWLEDGTKKISCNFNCDEFGLERLNGMYTEWFSNGNKKCEGNFRNSCKNKKWTFWYGNGNKKREEFYKYEDCGLEDYASYECPCATWTYYNENGSILKTEKYTNGLPEK
jgi:antitoxin component YwqK of YwqJK toxin-antitoxin module